MNNKQFIALIFAAICLLSLSACEHYAQADSRPPIQSRHPAHEGKENPFKHDHSKLYPYKPAEGERGKWLEGLN